MMKSNAQFLIQNERTLLKLFAARNPVTVLYFVVPYFLTIVYLAREYNYSPLEAISYLMLSLFYWSLAEYCIHRYFFHFKSRFKTLNYMIGSFHIYHHKNPEDLNVINSGWITAFFGLFLHGSIFYLLSASFKSTFAILMGTLIIYYYYEWIHYLVHQKVYKGGLMKYYQDFHLTHHIKPKSNYGQITPIWDFVFRTKIESIDTCKNTAMLKFIKRVKYD